MRLFEKEVELVATAQNRGLLEYLPVEIKKHLRANETPVRFVITQSTRDKYLCELGVLGGEGTADVPAKSIFDFNKRAHCGAERFNAVMIVPTGIGAEVGGHAGDANRAVRLLASACDQLITHPNAVNAADINEMPDNCLYVEGSLLTRLLMGTIGLEKVRANRLLVIIDDLRHDPQRPEIRLFTEAAINAVSAARATLGLDCSQIALMREPISMRSMFSGSGRAVGRVDGLERLLKVIEGFKDEFDAIALSSVVDIEDAIFDAYYRGDILNPWGGVEAMLTHAVTSIYDVPAAHSPMLESIERMNADLGVVDPRMAAEAVSLAALHSVLKGLHKSPRVLEIGPNGRDAHVISASDISCLVTPDSCIGLPHLAALEQGIPVIAVRDDQQTMKNRLKDFPFSRLYTADNYLEAAGIMLALKEGVSPNTIKMPLSSTNQSIIEL